MIKNLVKIFLLIFTNIALSQSGTNSPYSYTGLGEVNFRGNQINRFMGGLEVYNDSIHANLGNPSSYARLLLTQRRRKLTKKYLLRINLMLLLESP